MFYIQFANNNKNEAIKAGGFYTYAEAEETADSLLEFEPMGMYYTIIEHSVVARKTISFVTMHKNLNA